MNMMRMFFLGVFAGTLLSMALEPRAAFIGSLVGVLVATVAVEDERKWP